MILTKEQCDFIVSRNEAFYKKEFELDGQQISIYNYRLASFRDFDNPTNAQIKTHRLRAYELRGLTFVNDEPWIHLHKFFNVGETLGYEVSELKEKNIVRVMDKLDGSLIAFVKLNSQWRAKTKQVFDNDQAMASQAIYETVPEYRHFLDQCYEQGLMPLWEFTAPNNRVVVPYKTSELSLLQVRCKTTGTYYDTRQFEGLGFPLAKNVFDSSDNVKLDTMLELADETQGIEGWILVFDDGQIAKLKTKWYTGLHRVRFQTLASDVDLLRLTLEESIDDHIASIDDMPELKEEIEMKVDIFRHYFNHHQKEIERIAATFNNYETRKDFYLANKDYEYISLVMNAVTSGTFNLVDCMLKKFNTQKSIKEGILL